MIKEDLSFSSKRRQDCIRFYLGLFYDDGGFGDSGQRYWSHIGVDSYTLMREKMSSTMDLRKKTWLLEPTDADDLQECITPNIVRICCAERV
jgi:hypothetical protein